MCVFLNLKMLIFTLQLFIFLSILIYYILNLKNITNNKLLVIEILFLLLLVSCVYFLHNFYMNQLYLIARDILLKGNSLSAEHFSKSIMQRKMFPYCELVLSLVIFITLVYLKIFHKNNTFIHNQK